MNIFLRLIIFPLVRNLEFMFQHLICIFIFLLIYWFLQEGFTIFGHFLLRIEFFEGFQIPHQDLIIFILFLQFLLRILLRIAILVLALILFFERVHLRLFSTFSFSTTSLLNTFSSRDQRILISLFIIFFILLYHNLATLVVCIGVDDRFQPVSF